MIVVCGNIQRFRVEFSTGEGVPVQGRNLNLAKGNYRPDGQILRTSNHRPINRKRKLLLNGLTINLPRRNDRKDRIAREITGIHTIKNLHQIKPAHLNNGVVTAREASLEKVRVQLLTTTEGGEVLRDQLTFELLAAVAFRGKDDMRIRSIDRTANRLIGGDDFDFAVNSAEVEQNVADPFLDAVGLTGKGVGRQGHAAIHHVRGVYSDDEEGRFRVSLELVLGCSKDVGQF